MVSKLQRALIAYKVAGTQARKLKTTEAIGLTTGRKRIVLQDVYGGLTAAGKYWTEELKQTIPPSASPARSRGGRATPRP